MVIEIIDDRLKYEEQIIMFVTKLNLFMKSMLCSKLHIL